MAAYQVGDAPVMLEEGRRDEIGEIAPVRHAGNELEPAARALALPIQPAAEMAGILGERAHVVDAGVEQVGTLVGGIGYAAADILPSLHDGDAQPLRCEPPLQQVGGGERSARSSADNGYMQRHRPTSQVAR